MYNTSIMVNLDNGLNSINTKMYNAEHTLAEKHLYIAKGLSVSIALIDLSSGIVKTSALIIDRLVTSILNVLGASFSANCSFEDAFRSLYSAVALTGNLFGKIASSPFDFAYQTVKIFKSPIDVSELSRSRVAYLDSTKKIVTKREVVSNVDEVKS